MPVESREGLPNAQKTLSSLLKSLHRQTDLIQQYIVLLKALTNPSGDRPAQGLEAFILHSRLIEKQILGLDGLIELYRAALGREPETREYRDAVQNLRRARTLCFRCLETAASVLSTRKQMVRQQLQNSPFPRLSQGRNGFITHSRLVDVSV